MALWYFCASYERLYVPENDTSELDQDKMAFFRFSVSVPAEGPSCAKPSAGMTRAANTNKTHHQQRVKLCTSIIMRFTPICRGYQELVPPLLTTPILVRRRANNPQTSAGARLSMDGKRNATMRSLIASRRRRFTICLKSHDNRASYRAITAQATCKALSRRANASNSAQESIFWSCGFVALPDRPRLLAFAGLGKAFCRSRRVCLITSSAYCSASFMN